jgi:hypothetical protein
MATAKHIYKIFLNNNWNSTLVATPKKIAEHIAHLRDYHSRSGAIMDFRIESVRPVDKGEVLKFKAI